MVVAGVGFNVLDKVLVALLWLLENGASDQDLVREPFASSVLRFLMSLAGGDLRSSSSKLCVSKYTRYA